VAPAVDNHEK